MGLAMLAIEIQLIGQSELYVNSYVETISHLAYV
jgi:hypothetical protein